MQISPTIVVDEIPDNIRNAGGLAQYPVTNMIDTLRRDSTAIRGDAPLRLLQTVVQNLEHRALLEHNDAMATRSVLDNTRNENTRLLVENAGLKKDVQQRDSDRDSRTAFLSIGALGLGISIPFAIGSVTVPSILSVAAFLAVFLCAMFYPKRK